MAKKKHLRSKTEKKSPRSLSKSPKPSRSLSKSPKPLRSPKKSPKLLRSLSKSPPKKLPEPLRSSKKSPKPSRSSKKFPKPSRSPKKLPTPSPSLEKLPTPSQLPKKLPTPLIIHRSTRGPSFIRGSPEPKIELLVPPIPSIEFLIPESPILHDINKSKSFSYLDSPDFFMSQPSRYGKQHVQETPLVSEFNKLRRAEKLKKILAMQMDGEKKDFFSSSDRTAEDFEMYRRKTAELSKKLEEATFDCMVFPLFLHCWGKKLIKTYRNDAIVTPERLARFTMDFPEEASILVNQFKDLCSF